MSRFFLLIILCISANFRSQQELEIRWGNKPFFLDTIFVLNDSTQIRISQFKCYLQASEPNSPPNIILLDAAESSKISFINPLLSLQLGMDPALQNQSNFKGTLDPIHGMYWTWNSGYIQLKCVGELFYGSMEKAQHFELHLGGIQAPYICTFPIVSTGQLIIFDVAKWINAIQDSKQIIPNIMQPGAESLGVFQCVKNAFNYAQ